jgi:hypothetical protein
MPFSAIRSQAASQASGGPDREINALQRARNVAWITRTYAYDEFIKQQIRDGVDMVRQPGYQSRCASLSNDFAKKDQKNDPASPCGCLAT